MRRHAWMGLWLGLVLAGPAAASDSARPDIDRDHVKVWTYPVPGQALHGFRAETTVRSSLAGLVGLLMDTAAAPRWVYRTERIELLARDDGAGTFTARAELDFWPLRDRDVVLDGRIEQDPRTLVVSVVSRNISLAAAPPRAAFVRMPGLRGTWEFRPLPEGLVEVVMSGYADPGGHIPDFLVNQLIRETPYRTLRGLRRMIAAPKYQQSRFEGIREPQ